MELNKLNLLESIRLKQIALKTPKEGELTGISLYNAILEEHTDTIKPKKPVLGTEIYHGGNSKFKKVPKKTEPEEVNKTGDTAPTAEPMVDTPNPSPEENKASEASKEEIPKEDPTPKADGTDKNEVKATTTPTIDEVENKSTIDFVSLSSFTEPEKKALLSAPPELWHPIFPKELLVDYSDFIEDQESKDGDSIVRCIDSELNKINVPYKYLDRYFGETSQVTLKLGRNNVDFLEMKNNHAEGIVALKMGKDTIIKYKEGNTAFFDRGVPPEIFSSETSGSVLQAVSEYIVKDEDHSKTKEPEAKSKEPSKVETKPTQEIPAKVTKSRKKHPVSKKKINPKVNDNVIKKPRQPTLAQQLKVKFDAREPLKTDDDVMNFAQRGFVKGYKSIKEIDTLLKRANEIVDTGLKGNALNKALNQSLLTEFPLRKT